MKILHILTLMLVALVAYTSAQRCIGRPRSPSCNGPRNPGRFRRGCIPRTMWYWDSGSRQCRQMLYMGCGGNSNRWCNSASCEQRCRR